VTARLDTVMCSTWDCALLLSGKCSWYRIWQTTC